MTVRTAADAGGGQRAFVGLRCEAVPAGPRPAFNLINPAAPVRSGDYNVHTLALEISQTRLTAAGNTDGIIGV